MNYRTAIFSSDYCRDFVFPADVLKEAAGYSEILLPILSAATYSEHLDRLAQADMILATWRMPQLDADFLALVPKLKAVFYAAGTIKGFVTDESWERGIVVSSAAEANAIPVAEYAFSVIVLSLKQFWQHTRKTRAGHWKRDFSVAGTYRAKVGLVSFGAIARRLADRLRQTEVEILAYDPFCPPDVAAAQGVTLVALEELFSQSDVVSLHTPWLPETEKMINASLLGRMKPGATLINTARGALINETDLCRVLAERPDLTAVLDVTYPEPPPADSPLFSLDNIVLSPHIAGSVGKECARMSRWMVEEMRRYLAGEPLHHAVTEEMLARMA